jgi:hypothetical protein
MIHLIEQFKATNGAIYSFTQQLNINADLLSAYNIAGKNALDIYSDLHKQIKDEKIFKTLSLQEQQVLYENTRNYGEFLENLKQETTYFYNTRQPLNIMNSIANMTTTNMMLVRLIELLGGTSGRLVYAKLKHIHEHGWNKIDYKSKVFNLSAEMDNLITDVDNHITTIIYSGTQRALFERIYTSLVEAQAWFENEYDRISAEGMPKTRDITLPKIIEPKVPEQEDQPKKE